MALIKCPDCGKEISDKATVCIHCGYPLSEINNQEEKNSFVSECSKIVIENSIPKNKNKKVGIISICSVIFILIIVFVAFFNKEPINDLTLNSSIDVEIESIVEILSSERNEILSNYLGSTDEDGVIVIPGSFAELDGKYKVFMDGDIVSRVIFVRDEEITDSEKIVKDISTCLGNFDTYDSEWKKYEWKSNGLKLMLYVDERIYFELYDSDEKNISKEEQYINTTNTDALFENDDISNQFKSVKLILEANRSEDILDLFEDSYLSDNENIIIEGMFSNVEGSYEVYCWNNKPYQIVFRWNEYETITSSQIVSDVNENIGKYTFYNEYWDIYEWEKDNVEISFNVEDGIWFEPIFDKGLSFIPKIKKHAISQSDYMSLEEEYIENEISIIEKMMSYTGKPKEQVFLDYPDLVDDDWNQLIMSGNMFGIEGEFAFIYSRETGLVYSVVFIWIPDNMENHENHVVYCLDKYFGEYHEVDYTDYDNETYYYHDWDATTSENWSVHLSMTSDSGWLQFSQLETDEDEEQPSVKESVCIECGKSASYTYTNPFSNKIENYCYTHYNEIIDMIGEMEEDVGEGSYNKHTCEECNREGTHSIIGISGQIEYYCTTHYNELKEFMQVLQ